MTRPCSERQGLAAVADAAAAQRSAEETRRRRAPGTDGADPATHGHTKGGRLGSLAAGGQPSTLVLYDTAGPYGFLGELYAMVAANLAGPLRHRDHQADPLVHRRPDGELHATVYIGSTYYGDELPDAVPDDFYLRRLYHRAAGGLGRREHLEHGRTPSASRSSSTGTAGTRRRPSTRHGSVGQITKVDYKGQPLTRKIPAGAGRRRAAPRTRHRRGLPAVTELAQAGDTAGSRRRRPRGRSAPAT